MTDPRIEPAARSLWDDHRVSRDPDWEDIVASGERYADDVGQMRDMATAALAAADKAATVTTVEELEALPVGAVILDGDPAVLEMKEKSSIYGSTWWMAGSDYEYTSGKITLPARVIHFGGQA